MRNVKIKFNTGDPSLQLERKSSPSSSKGHKNTLPVSPFINREVGRRRFGMKIGDYGISIHLTCCTQSRAVAAHTVVQYNHNQKVPGEGLPHWVRLSASAGADHKQWAVSL